MYINNYTRGVIRDWAGEWRRTSDVDCPFRGDVRSIADTYTSYGLQEPCGKNEESTVGGGYVDDVTLGVTIEPKTQPVKEAVEAIRKAGQI